MDMASVHGALRSAPPPLPIHRRPPAVGNVQRSGGGALHYPTTIIPNGSSSGGGGGGPGILSSRTLPRRNVDMSAQDGYGGAGGTPELPSLPSQVASESASRPAPAPRPSAKPPVQTKPRGDFKVANSGNLKPAIRPKPRKPGTGDALLANASDQSAKSARLQVPHASLPASLVAQSGDAVATTSTVSVGSSSDPRRRANTIDIPSTPRGTHNVNGGQKSPAHAVERENVVGGTTSSSSSSLGKRSMTMAGSEFEAERRLVEASERELERELALLEDVVTGDMYNGAAADIPESARADRNFSASGSTENVQVLDTSTSGAGNNALTAHSGSNSDVFRRRGSSNASREARLRANSASSAGGGPFRPRQDSFGRLADRTAMAEVRDWFLKLGLPQYADSFISNGYDDMTMLGMLDDSDLHICGVDNVEHRRQILKGAAEEESTADDPDDFDWERPSSPQDVEVRIRQRTITSEDVEARARESMARNSLSHIMEQLKNIGGGGGGVVSPKSPTPLSPLATSGSLTCSAPALQKFDEPATDLTGDPDIDLDDLLYDLVKFDPQRAIEAASTTPPETPEPPEPGSENPNSATTQMPKKSVSTSLLPTSSGSFSPGSGDSVVSPKHGGGLERKISLPVKLGRANDDEEKRLMSSMWETLGTVSQEQEVRQPTVVHTAAEAQKATLEVEKQIKEFQQTLEDESIWTDAEIKQKVKAEKMRIAMERIKEARVAQGLIHTYNEDGSQRSLVANEKMDAWTAAHQLAIKAEADMQKPWVLVEKDDEFNLERTLEDHELVYLISSRWPRTGTRRFIFKIDFKKNDMFENPEAYFPSHIKVAGVFLQRPQERVEKARQTFIKDYFTGTMRIPELETQCYLREKVKSWKKYHCVIRSSGLYYAKSKNKDSKNLLCYAKFNSTDIFEAFNYKKTFKCPTEHVLALRPDTGACPNGMIKCIAFESRPDLLSWKAGLRCAKYGMKLRENFELSQRRQMVINRMFTNRSVSAGELRSPPLSRGGTIKLIPIKQSDDTDGGFPTLSSTSEGTEPLSLQDPPPGKSSAVTSSDEPVFEADQATSYSSLPLAERMTYEVIPATPVTEGGGAPTMTSNANGYHEELPPTTMPQLIGAVEPREPSPSPPPLKPKKRSSIRHDVVSGIAVSPSPTPPLPPPPEDFLPPEEQNMPFANHSPPPAPATESRPAVPVKKSSPLMGRSQAPPPVDASSIEMRSRQIAETLGRRLPMAMPTPSDTRSVENSNHSPPMTGAHRNAHGGGGGGDRAQPHFPPPPPIQHHQREVEQHQQQHQQGPPLHAASNASIPTRVSPVPARGSPRMSPRMSPQPPPPSTEPPPLPYKAGGTLPPPRTPRAAPSRTSAQASDAQPPPVPTTERPFAQTQPPGPVPVARAPPPPAAPVIPGVGAALSTFGPSAAPQPFAQHVVHLPPRQSALPGQHFAAPAPPATLPREYTKPQKAGAHESQPWFHGPLPRTAAENILMAAGGHNGMYLVRESSKVPGSFVMTMMAHGRVHNFHIEAYTDGQVVAYGIDNSPRFPTLGMLLDHFRQNSQRLPCSLSYFVERG